MTSVAKTLKFTISSILYVFRYTAVDEESPGTASRRLASTSPSASPDSRNPADGMLELRLSTHGDVFSTKTSPVKKSQKCDDEECTARLQGLPRSDDESPVETRIPSVTVNRREPEDRGNLVRISSKPSQDIREVRKDSALYLEEVEGLKDLRESLRSRSPRSLTPRRDSSGYASNLGTFDDERRASDVDLTSVRERRRSSTKRLTSETFLPSRRISRNDDNSSDVTTERISENQKTREDMNDIEEVREKIEEKTVSSSEILSYAEVLSKSSRPSPSVLNRTRNLSRVESFDVDDSTGKMNHSSIINQISTKVQMPRKRIVHQYSTPNFSSMELESILEKPVEKSPMKPIKCVETLVTVEVASETDDSTESCAKTTPAKNLPKSIKVYQLLSTQSEDRGDGVPNLADRRISLQISRQDEDQLETSGVEEKAVAVTEENSESRVVESDIETSSGVKHLTPTMASSSSLPVRKLSTPAEMGSSQRLLGDSGIGIRPIYPYCPYSPYGSPQGSPRTRRRPLRESRRVSIDNRQGALQLNQYKLLDNIGQVRC